MKLKIWLNNTHFYADNKKIIVTHKIYDTNIYNWSLYSSMPTQTFCKHWILSLICKNSDKQRLYNKKKKNCYIIINMVLVGKKKRV